MEVDGIRDVMEASATLPVGGNDTKIKIATAHGTANVASLLDSIRAGEKEYHFIEIMACPGGCVHGGAGAASCFLKNEAGYQSESEKGDGSILEKYKKEFEKIRQARDFIDDDKIWVQLDKWENPSNKDVWRVLEKRRGASASTRRKRRILS